VYKAELTIDKEGVIEGDMVLLSLLQTKAMFDKNKEIEIKGHMWCG